MDLGLHLLGLAFIFDVFRVPGGYSPDNVGQRPEYIVHVYVAIMQETPDTTGKIYEYTWKHNII